MRGSRGIEARAGGGGRRTASPCGACRQWLLEFRVDRVVFPWEGGVAVRTLDELLPEFLHAVTRVPAGGGVVAAEQLTRAQRPGRLAGRPNVGKSTLVNVLCEARSRSSPTSPRPRAVASAASWRRRVWQLVLVDLPGFQRPRDPLTERMQRRVDTSFGEVDASLPRAPADEQIGAGDRFVANARSRDRRPS